MMYIVLEGGDFMTLFSWHMWLACAVFFFVIELNAPALVSIWFSIGALCTSVLAVFIHNPKGQFFSFVIVSAILLVLSKHLYHRNVEPVHKDEILEKFLEKRAKVCDDIPNDYETGTISINGVTWKAVSMTGEKIPKGSIVVVKKVDGLTLGVKLLKNKEG